MIRRKDDVPLQKHTLNLFKGDFEKLQSWYSALGASKIVRELVRAQVRRVEEDLANKRPPTVAELDISVDFDDVGNIRVEPL